MKRSNLPQSRRRRYPCAIRLSWAGPYTYGVGGWPLAEVSIDDACVRVGPAIIPLVALMAAGLLLGLALDSWFALLTPAALLSLGIIPRRTFPLSAIRVRETRIRLGSRAVELSTDPGTDKVWVWCLPVDKLLAEIAQHEVTIAFDGWASSA
jgi:hypothetical protein